MKVALFQPWAMSDEWATFFYLPSYGLLRLGALYPGSKIYNGMVLGKDGIMQVLESEKFDLVGVSAQTANRHPAREILNIAYNRGAITVVGGHHPTAMPKFFDLPYVDYIVRGHGEKWWDMILEGEDVPHITQLDYGGHPDDYPAADWTQVVPDPMDEISYSPVYTPLHVATSYGCDGSCLYCISRMMHGGKVKRRKPELVRDEVMPLYERGARRLYVIDECFGGDIDHAVDTCAMIKESFPGLTWSTFGRVDCLSEDLVVTMADSGCCALIIGFESGDQEMLRRIGKGYVDVERYDDLVRWCRENGITVSCQTMDGLPYETDAHKHLTRLFLKRNRLRPQSVGHTIVMPGMPLYNLCVRAGLLDDSFWEGPDLYYRYQGGLVWRG